MAHTSTFRNLMRLLQQARRMYLLEAGLPKPIDREAFRASRRQFLGRTALGGAGSVMLATMPGLMRDALADNLSTSRIAIIGGGLAGLNAAYQLKKAGLNADVYEGRHRLGGRVHSVSFPNSNGLIVEAGAEFINTDHDDMMSLVTDLGLPLFDRHADAMASDTPGSAYYFEGKSWSEAEMALLLQALAAQISQDAELLDTDWDTYAPVFDQLSVTAYLDQHADLIPQGFIRQLMENAIRVEYGVEPDDSSALQLLFLLPTVDGHSVELLGYSDEAFNIVDGNARIIDGLADALTGQIHTGMVLKELEMEEEGGPIELEFTNGESIEADYVILALPFTALRHVRLNAPLPGRLKQFIKQVDLGNNEKLLAGFQQRSWHAEGGFTLDAWTDLDFASLWDASQRQGELENGVLTYYL
ncbi:MAG: FAD-dependent oxidoreductase, partial [Gammaproteobacteria bacterium]|nr:FAD-dependent oxidoreductase [Gammaproteobacteria bacterium]